jgi:hypothetical protein
MGPVQARAESIYVDLRYFDHAACSFFPLVAARCSKIFRALDHNALVDDECYGALGLLFVDHDGKHLGEIGHAGEMLVWMMSCDSVI